jgi:putative oxidoreductase
MSDEKRIQISLLGLRLGVFIVFMAWTLDKILNYQHNSVMIMHYYNVEVPQWFLMSLGMAELILLLVFLAGMFKTFTYGVILFAHTVTTLVSSWRLLPPYEVHQLLYFGSLPMLGACVALFLMREKDTLMTFARR